MVEKTVLEKPNLMLLEICHFNRMRRQVEACCDVKNGHLSSEHVFLSPQLNEATDAEQESQHVSELQSHLSKEPRQLPQ